MAWFNFFWYEENVEHIAQHGVSMEEFEHVVRHPKMTGESDSSGRPLVKGFTKGRTMARLHLRSH
jgi:hypothetical protein